MITLFTSEGCPRCDIIKKKLEDKKIDYSIGDNQEIIEVGFKSVPVLKVEDEYMDFGKAVNFVNKY